VTGEGSVVTGIALEKVDSIWLVGSVLIRSSCISRTLRSGISKGISDSLGPSSRGAASGARSGPCPGGPKEDVGVGGRLHGGGRCDSSDIVIVSGCVEEAGVGAAVVGIVSEG